MGLPYVYVWLMGWWHVGMLRHRSSYSLTRATDGRKCDTASLAHDNLLPPTRL